MNIALVHMKKNAKGKNKRKDEKNTVALPYHTKRCRIVLGWSDDDVYKIFPICPLTTKLEGSENGSGRGDGGISWIRN